MKTLCIYCGSSPGANPDYVAAGKKLAAAMVEHDLNLVYGGAHVGIMGAVADELMNHGGKVVGIIPESLVKLEVAHQGLTELHVVADMHERKSKMVELADGFVALPGGLGTFEELFEVLTWSQLGFHTKPCSVLNVSGFYDQLLQFLDTACKQEFMQPSHRDLLLSDTDPHALIEKLKSYKPAMEPKLGKAY